jgi:cobalt-zinc-cadmium efflux system membrane fusion protein
MVMNNKFILSILAACMSLASCNHNNNKNEISTETPDDLISITEEQFFTNNMAIGEPSKMQFDELVECTGNIVIEPSGTFMISTPIPGLVKRIECKEGSDVRAGQPLFALGGNDFIELQKDFAEAESHLKRVKSEYDRVKSLYDEKVGTEKDLMMAESEYKAANARYSALKMKIKMLGLDETRISDGSFYESFSIRSPINGYVTRIDVALDQYADQQTPMAELLDLSKMEVRMSVFEKDLGNLVQNQKVEFNLLGKTNKIHTATLKSIGKDVEHDSKTVYCYADIDDRRHASFVNNAYVEASIITKSDSVKAVPEEAVLKSEDSSYLLEFVKNENGNYYLKKTKVSPGRLYKGCVELLNPPDLGKILTRGAYNIGTE